MVDLLECAERVAVTAAAPTPAPGGLRDIQARADSLRVVLARRALEREGGETSLDVRLRELRGFERVPLLEEVTAGQVRLEPGEGHAFVFRFDDHLMDGLRGVAGAEVADLEPELAEYFRNADRGLLVLRIAPDTPADRAGLAPGDVVTAADGRRVESVAELRQILALPQAGGVTLRVVRKGRVRDLTLPRS